MLNDVNSCKQLKNLIYFPLSFPKNVVTFSVILTLEKYLINFRMHLYQNSFLLKNLKISVEAYKFPFNKLNKMYPITLNSLMLSWTLLQISIP